jgi:hypothetical protein
MAEKTTVTINGSEISGNNVLSGYQFGLHVNNNTCNVWTEDKTRMSHVRTVPKIPDPAPDLQTLKKGSILDH